MFYKLKLVVCFLKIPYKSIVIIITLCTRRCVRLSSGLFSACAIEVGKVRPNRMVHSMAK